MRKVFEQKISDNLDMVMEQLEITLIKLKLQKQFALRMKLYYEHLLLDLIDRGKTDMMLTVHKSLISLKVSVWYGGEQFNLLDEQDDQNEFSALMYRNLGLESNYTYQKRGNTITGCYRIPIKLPIGGLATTLILAICTAIALKMLRPEVCEPLSRGYLEPLVTLLIRLVKFIICPIIFVSQVTTIASFENFHQLNQVIKTLLKRFIVIVLTVLAFSLTTAMLLWGQIDNSLSGSMEGLSMTALVEQVPSNILQPILESDILQIIILSSLIGLGLLSLGNRKDILLSFFEGITDVFMYILSLFSKIMPFFIFACFLNMIISPKGDSFVDAMLACLLVQVATAAVVIGHLLFIAKKPIQKRPS